MNDAWLSFQYGLAAFVIGLLLIAVSNLKAWQRMNRYPAPARFPRASILVPARNEEDNIEGCVRSLLAQDYPDFEVLVLNDDSGDRTRSILAALDDEPRLRVLIGKPLPPDWLGKHWACHQLAQAATGDLLLFTDADTRHHPQALRDAVAALHAERADLLSALPRQIVGSWAERLIVPIIPWSLFALIPLAVAHRLRRTSLVVAVGQYMLFRHEAYDRSGGHAAVRQNAVDDIALARRIVSQGLRWRRVDGGGRIDCRMYRNLGHAMEGLSKNLFAAFDYGWPQSLFVWTWMGLVFVIWPMLLGLGQLGVMLPNFSLEAAVVAAVGSIGLWLIVTRRFSLPAYLALLYPISMALTVIIAFRSMALTLTGRATWRGRTLAVHKSK